MRVLVIGLGSMGKRRIRLIRQLDPQIEIAGVDAREDRQEEARKLFETETFASVDAALAGKSADCAFVSTSPLSHGPIIQECLEKKLHVFTELNLVTDLYSENMEKAERNGLVLFLSSTFLYRKEIQFIENTVKEYGKAVNYNYHVGQYLPDWHPWENYKAFFAGNKRTNGCREIFAIELPWISAAFGPIKAVSGIHDKNSTLEIGYDDNYLVQIVHENGCKGNVSIDVVCPKAVRNLEVYGEHLYLKWDGTPDGLEQFLGNGMKQIRLYDEYEHREGYQATIVENAYKEEIRAFFLAVGKGKQPVYGFKNDAVILGWIDQIEGLK